MKRFLYVLLIFFAAISCTGNLNEQPVTGINKEIESYELFQQHCITCHTLQYIEMQPNFPRKTWEKIADKMVKNFGAPIPDSSLKKIVDYLVIVKGTGEN